MRTLLVAGSMLVFVSAASAADLPTPSLTPGDTITTVTTDKAAQCLSDKTGQSVSVGDPITQDMICTSGYTQCVRNVSTSTKNAAYHGYGLSGNHTGYCTGNEGCEVDHLISLEIGGANTVKNLWPQSYDSPQWNAHVKDKLENFLHKEVCAGTMPLEQAQKEISEDWIAAYKKHLGEP